MASVTKALARRFARDQSGSTATIFGIMSIAICAMIGLSIDFGRYVVVRQSLQSSLDEAIIAIASKRQSGTDAGQQKFEAHLNANWKEKHGATPAQLTIVDVGSNLIEAKADTSLPTLFIRVLGFDTLPVSLEASSRYGMQRSEVALALDVTASMSGAKLQALQSVAKGMVSDVYRTQGAAQNVKFSIVPFGQYVNVGTRYRNDAWLDVPPDGRQQICTKTRPVTGKSGCTTSRVPVMKEGQLTTYVDSETCTSYSYGPEVETCGQVDYTWNGCVGSRSYPLDEMPKADSQSRIPGLPNITCSSPLTRLTASKVDLEAAIDGLTATGETFIPAGMLWGWRTLSNEAPFADGAGPDPRDPTRKVLVLMTDGENTRSPSGATHDGVDLKYANATTEKLCVDMKKANISIYTVAFEVSDMKTLDVLRACATSDEQFFDAKDTTRLQAAFSKIGDALTLARLVK
jgi:Flp pilus assembly pilin Flp